MWAMSIYLPQIRRLLRPKSTWRSSAPKEDYRWIRQWRCTTVWVRSWKSCRSPCTANRKPRHAHASNSRDADDWPGIACALTLGCPIWTEDRDFFGAGVPTWTTDRV